MTYIHSKHNEKKTPPQKTPPSPSKIPEPAQLIELFGRIVALQGLCPPEGMYERVWAPVVTLWYLIWQGLQPHHTLEAVVTDARRGGADALVSKPLSAAIKSKATTAYSDARQRLPIQWVRRCFDTLVQALQSLSPPPSQDWPVQLLDGSTQRLRPYGDIARHFPPQRTRRKRSYWCVARVLVSFCATCGIATAAQITSIHVSEQAAAVELILQAAKRVLYIGDRNFGVWRVTRAAVQGGGQALFRLTKVRARRLFGKKHLPSFLDQRLLWSPSAHDQVDPGLDKQPVLGRLIIVPAARGGSRAQTLYLFTTLLDAQAFPPQRLLDLYGRRWQAELNFRAVKTTLQMDQSEAKSAEMVRKEFYAGLMAYNLVRGLMAASAAQSQCSPLQLSFSKVHVLLASILTELFATWMSATIRQSRLRWLLTEAAQAKLPRRRKLRPSEPRAQYYKPQVFPKITGTRADARQLLKNSF